MSTINAKNEYAAERPAKFFAIFQVLFILTNSRMLMLLVMVKC